MAKIPTYDGQQVRNSEVQGGYANVSASPKSFGTDLGDAATRLAPALADAGNTLARDGMQKRAEQDRLTDTALARDTFNALSNDTRNFEADYYARGGKAAIGMTTEATKKYDEMMKKHEASLQTPEQRSYFRAAADVERNSFLDRVAAKERDEVAKFNEVTLAGENMALTDKSVSNRTLPSVIAENDFLMGQNIKASKAYKEADASVQELMLKKATNDHYTAVLHAIDSDSPTAAKAFLEQNRDKFRPEVYSALLDEQKKRSTGEYIANRAKELSASGAPLELQLAAADKEKDPVVGEKIRKQILERSEVQAKITEYNSKLEVAREVQSYYDDPKGYMARGGYKGHNDDVAKALTAAYKTQKQMLKDKIGGNGVAPRSDWGTYNDLATRIANGESPNLDEYADNLDSDMHQKLNGMMLNRLEAGTAKQKEDLARKWQLDARINSAIKDLPAKHFDPDKGGEEARARKSALVQSMYNELAALPPEKQTPDAVDGMLKNMTDKFITKSWVIFNKENYRFEADKLKGEERTRYFVQNPPDNLKGSAGLQWDDTRGMYFRVTGDTAIFYDKFGRPAAKANVSGKKAPQGIKVTTESK